MMSSTMNEGGQERFTSAVRACVPSSAVTDGSSVWTWKEHEVCRQVMIELDLAEDDFADEGCLTYASVQEDLELVNPGLLVRLNKVLDRGDGETS